MEHSGGAVRRDPSLPLPFGGGVGHKLELLCVVLQLLSLGFRKYVRLGGRVL